MKKCRFITQRP